MRLFARRRLRKPEAVDEFAQDVMLRADRGAPRGDGERPGAPGRFRSGHLPQPGGGSRPPEGTARGVVAAVRQRAGAAGGRTAGRRDLLRGHSSGGLPDPAAAKSRDVVRLAYGEARSADEIAAQLGTSAVNARVLRHRALQALRTCMSKRISWEELDERPGEHCCASTTTRPATCRKRRRDVRGGAVRGRGRRRSARRDGIKSATGWRPTPPSSPGWCAGVVANESGVFAGGATRAQVDGLLGHGCRSTTSISARAARPCFPPGPAT